ncbi:MAG: hypothetical protein KIT34_06590 [Cyanobacteria bacterium TGS_CYA1]|nr:hypothetical protein [Cyanobacteria bacterium TGS_CYA1]
MLNPDNNPNSNSNINRKLVLRYKTALLSSFESEPSAMQIREKVNSFSLAEEESLTMFERGALLQDLLDEVFGFGPLGAILRDPSLREIFVSNYDKVLIRTARQEKMGPSEVVFESLEHYLKIVERILTKNNLRLSPENPIETITFDNGMLIVFTSIEGQTAPTLRVRVNV